MAWWCGLMRLGARQETREALMTLSESSRPTVHYVDVQDCCYQALAGVVAMPVGTEASRPHRGGRRLRTSTAVIARARGHHPTQDTFAVVVG
jgi:DNA-directed RNA polymerase specialized sigma24 family protein